MYRLLLALLIPLLTGMAEYPLVGTAVTLVPVGHAQPLDPRLFGSWRLPSDERRTSVKISLRQSPTFVDRYEVEAPFYFGRPVEGRLVRVGKDPTPGLTVIECSVATRVVDGGLLLPARHHFLVRLDGERLVVSLLSVQLGYMARSGRVLGSHRARDLEMTSAGPVDVIVGDQRSLQEHLVLASQRILPRWVLTFERER